MLFKKTQRKFKTIRKEKSFNQQAKSLSLKLEIGSILAGRYEILKEIAEGAFSTAYKVYDKQKDKLKTIKLFGKYVEIFNSINEIRHEAKLLQELIHENLPVFNELIEDDFVFFDLDYIDGLCLKELLAKKITHKRANKLAHQLAETLFFIHFKNVEHLDVKPENILITNDDKLFLTDFGTAAIEKIHNNDIELEATYPYLAPEALTEKTKFPQRDIFAYGILLYEMFYNKYPFTLDENDKPDYKMPLHLVKSKKKIDQIIKRCISYFSVDRYNNFQEILDDLNHVAEQENVVYKTLIKYIYKKLPLKNIANDFKKDLKYLWLSLLALLLLLPFFLYLEKLDSNIDREIHIDAPPFAVFVNTDYKGIAPINTKLKSGDLVSFIDNNGLTAYEMTFKNQKKLRIDIKENKIFVDKKLRGLHYRTNEKIPRQINFLRVDNNIKPAKLKRLRNRNLHLSLSPTAPDSLLNFLPPKLKSLSLRNIKKPLNLAKLNRLKRLNSLDLSNTDSLSVNSLPPLPTLKTLNTQNTGVSSIKRFPGLKHLNISHNKMKNLSNIAQSQNLETLNINDNSEIYGYSPLLKLPNIRQITNNNNDKLTTDFSEIQKLLSDNNYENLNKQRLIIHKKNKHRFLINFLVTLLMAAILVQIFRMIFKNSAKKIQQAMPELVKDDFDEKPETPKLLDLNHKQIIQAAINDKRWYLPEKDNALYYLSELSSDYKDNDFLKAKKKEVLKLLDDKLKMHQLRNEYEPIYLITKEINQYFPQNKYKKQFIKANKQVCKKLSLNPVFVKLGTFLMGDFSKRNNTITHALHDVKLDSFKITDTTITNEMFCEFLNSEGNQKEHGQTWIKLDSPYSRIAYRNGEYFAKEPYKSFPVYEVNWYGAQRFAEWKGGRLPTEAEWEYAARSRGEDVLFSYGNTVNYKKMNCLIDSNDSHWHSVFPVKSFKANDLGLYEMSGNILEWCYDWYDKDYYSYCSKNNPKGPRDGETKVVRGGAWCFDGDHAMTFYRGSAKPSTRNNYIGFRIVFTI